MMSKRFYLWCDDAFIYTCSVRTWFSVFIMRFLCSDSTTCCSGNNISEVQVTFTSPTSSHLHTLFTSAIMLASFHLLFPRHFLLISFFPSKVLYLSLISRCRSLLFSLRASFFIHVYPTASFHFILPICRFSYYFFNAPPFDFRIIVAVFDLIFHLWYILIIGSIVFLKTKFLLSSQILV